MNKRYAFEQLPWHVDIANVDQYMESLAFYPPVDLPNFEVAAKGINALQRNTGLANQFQSIFQSKRFIKLMKLLATFFPRSSVPRNSLQQIERWNFTAVPLFLQSFRLLFPKYLRAFLNAAGETSLQKSARKLTEKLQQKADSEAKVCVCFFFSQLLFCFYFFIFFI